MAQGFERSIRGDEILLSDTQLQRVQEVTADCIEPVKIVLHGEDSGSYFENNLRNIARQMTGVSLNQIQLEQGDEESGLFTPYLALINEGKECVFYHAMPEGSQFEPFLDLIGWLGRGSASGVKTAGSPEGTLRQDDLELLLFIASGCPHCPAAVRACSMILRNHPGVRLRIVDALYFTDWASRYKVKSTPTLVVDEGLTLVGNLSFQDLNSRIQGARDPDFATQILESMANTGRAEAAGNWMCKHKAARAILPIYRSPVFSQRMGALVVMEEALDQDPNILDEIVDDLILLLSDEDDGLRGDTAELLGKMGASRAFSALESLLSDPNEDVREAALEAFEKLKKTG